MFEHRSEPLLTRWQFLRRISKAFLATVLIAMVSVLGGTIGYHYLAGSDWSYSFHMACLALGNHDVNVHPDTTLGRVFSGMYMMYARLVFVSMIAILGGPLLHRILHKLHLDPDE